MTKRKIVALIVAILLMALPLTQVMADTRSNIEEALIAFKARTSDISDQLPDLIDIVERLQGKGALRDAFGLIAENEGLHSRFGNITEENIREALEIFKTRRWI
ncbi:MAG: hypothetical protein ACOX15_07940 [Tepidanaerobacteraceae bacterium]